MMNLDKIPGDVLTDAIDYLTENRRITVDEAREQIRNVIPYQVFHWYLEWNGIQGYSMDFWNAVDSLKAAEEKTVVSEKPKPKVMKFADRGQWLAQASQAADQQRQVIQKMISEGWVWVGVGVLESPDGKSICEVNG